MAHTYEVGTRAWQPDPTEGWLASEVKEKLEDGEKVQLIFELENGEVGVLEYWALDAQSCLLSFLGLLTLSRQEPWRPRRPSCRSITTPNYLRL